MIKSFPFILILYVTACNTENTTSGKHDYLRHVGDIEVDPKLDNLNFSLCHGDSSVKQYFNFGQGLQYEGEKKAIIDAFKNQYQPVESDDSGLIRVRFIVNCKGETGRFRVMAMNNEFKEKKFDSRITNQLLSLAKKLNGWKILPNTQEGIDYYQYLIFKVYKGNVIEILP